MSELVLAVNREQLNKQHVGTHGLYTINFNDIDPQDYAYLPRAYADNKSTEAILLGAMFPQILGYFQVVNPEGKILAYQRKGKEKGLFGKWSIGVGGHVSQEELFNVMETISNYPPIRNLIYEGAKRELEEEINLELTQLEEFAGGLTEFSEHVTQVLCSMNDATSSVHVGIPMEIELDKYCYENIKLDPAEFCNFKWMTKEELKASGLVFETWSQILVDSY